MSRFTTDKTLGITTDVTGGPGAISDRPNPSTALTGELPLQEAHFVVSRGEDLYLKMLLVRIHRPSARLTSPPSQALSALSLSLVLHAPSRRSPATARR